MARQLSVLISPNLKLQILSPTSVRSRNASQLSLNSRTCASCNSASPRLRRYTVVWTLARSCISKILVKNLGFRVWFGVDELSNEVIRVSDWD